MNDPDAFPARILAHGRLPWASLLPLADGLRCLWADHDGWHTGRCPDTTPTYTHLWACSPTRLLRVRIDDTDAIAAELAPTGQRGHEVPVRVLHPEPEPWAAPLVGGNLVLVRTETNSPISFAAFDTAARTWAERAPGKAT